MKALLVAGLATLISFQAAQGQHSTVIHLPHKTIEVVGLNRWTVQMIQDSMDRYSPGDSLQSDACAAVLRYKLHFADAAATDYPAGFTGTGEYVFVAVVEPQDSARVRYRMMPLDTLPALPQWREFVTFVSKHPAALEMGAMVYTPYDTLRDTVPTFARRDSAAIVRVLAFLRSHASRADAALSRQALATDRNVLNRAVAAAILANFDDDSARAALVATLRENDGLAKGIAMQTLTTVVNHGSQPIDWRLAANDIHAILDGTNLFALDQLMGLLVQTGVDSSLARPFLHHGGRAVLAFAGAEQPLVRASALGFLRTISGKDFGPDVARWSTWVNSL